MPTNEIVLPITKPETEWIRGRAVQKVSPKRDHSRVQGEFLIALSAWSRGRGEVGPEWRFRIAVAGESRRPLVPDIAFLSYERLRGFTREEIQAPAFAPNVAIEVFSPGDKRLDVASKIEVYLRAGCELVIVAYPKTRTMTLHDATSSNSLSADDTLRHAALPGFELPLKAFLRARSTCRRNRGSPEMMALLEDPVIAAGRRAEKICLANAKAATSIESLN